MLLVIVSGLCMVLNHRIVWLTSHVGCHVSHCVALSWPLKFSIDKMNTGYGKGEF